jgi:hypothetical protein
MMRGMAILAAFTAGVCAAQMAPPTLVPQTISMGSFYSGAQLHIEGTVPAGTEVAVIIRGNEQDEFFNRKSRYGVLWLNSDRIHIQRAPSILLSYSSGALQDMLSREQIDKSVLDEAAILRHIRCLCRCKCNLTERSRQSGARDSQPDAIYRAQIESDFLRLKEAEGDYVMRPHSVKIVPLPGGDVKYLLDVQWPAIFPPGNYGVEVLACSHKNVIARSTGALLVAETGFPSRVQQLAFASPWIYGAGAVLIALLAGFATDLCSTQLIRRRRHARGEGAGQGPGATEEVPAETFEEKETETLHRK